MINETSTNNRKEEMLSLEKHIKKLNILKGAFIFSESNFEEIVKEAEEIIRIASLLNSRKFEANHK